jgi:hypothetical protein
MKIHENVGTCLVMYASKKMSTPTLYDDKDSDDAILAKLSMHKKKTMQQM